MTPEAPATLPPQPLATGSTSWTGVLSVMLGAFALVTSEFLPASLLSPMAVGLHLSNGAAGQVVTVTAVIGIIAGPAVGILVPRMDRRTLLIILTVLATVSNLVVAVTGAFWLLLLARLLLGVAVSGFWSMALAVTAQLVSPARLGRAMMVVNTGVSLATVFALPLGAFLGGLLGWRAVFLFAAAVCAIATAVMRFALPGIAPANTANPRALFSTLRAPVMIVGLIGTCLLAGGHFMGFTYIRVGAAQIPQLSTGNLALLLAVFGLGGFIGNLLAGLVADRWLRPALIVWASLLGVGVAVFALLPGIVPLAFVAVGLWGFAFGGVPTLVQTWAARVEPNRMEAAGSLVVASLQLSIAVGSLVSGVLVDGPGITVSLVAGAISAVLGGLLLSSARNRSTPARATASTQVATAPD
ncbi:MAG: MFS transporter [Microbacteriaceae bacterium]